MVVVVAIVDDDDDVMLNGSYRQTHSESGAFWLSKKYI
jgi:hypothetical protein